MVRPIADARNAILVLTLRALRILAIYALVAVLGVVVLVVVSFPILRIISTFTIGLLLGILIAVASVLVAILQIEERSRPGTAKPRTGSIFQLPGGGRLSEHANFDIDITDESVWEHRAEGRIERYTEHPMFIVFVGIVLLVGALIISSVAHSAFTWGLTIALWVGVVAFAIAVASRLHSAG